jgi:hypothetical protein
MMIEAPLAALAVVPTLQHEAEVTGCQWLCLITGPGGRPPCRYKQVSPGCPKSPGPFRGPGHPRVCQWAGRVPAEDYSVECGAKEGSSGSPGARGYYIPG